MSDIPGTVEERHLLGNVLAAVDHLHEMARELRTAAKGERLSGKHVAALKCTAELREQWKRYEKGDAGKANNDYFRWRMIEGDGEAQILIECPTFLRGPLRLTVRGGKVGGAY
jgi:hypothetical protein